MQPKILFQKSDITDMAVDAVVNAANTELTMQAGLAAAIRGKGGKAIEEDCARLTPIALGGAVVTTGGNLRALYVIHAASMRPGEQALAESVRLATRSALMRAEEKTFRSIAFPALGAGAAGLPLAESARVMLKEVLEHIKSVSSLEKIHFVLYDDEALGVFQATYTELTGRPATVAR